MRSAWIWVIGSLLSVASSASGQSKVGTAIGQFLLIEPSARLGAMGNAGVALNDGLQSVYYNPGAIGMIQRYGVQVTHSEWLAGITYDYASISLPAFSYLGLCLTLTSLDSGDMEVRTVEKPLGTGERFSVKDVAVGLGGGMRITDRFSAGAQLNYVQETIWNSTMSTATLNVGTIYRLSENGLHLGSSISNIGTKGGFRGRDLAMQYDNDPSRYGDNGSLPGTRFTEDFPLPILFRVGLGKPWKLGPQTRLLIEVDAFHPSDNLEAVSGGMELTWKESYSLRAGYDDFGRKESEAGLTLGAGLKHELGSLDFQFDYAWADYDRLDVAHRMTLVVMF